MSQAPLPRRRETFGESTPRRSITTGTSAGVGRGANHSFAILASHRYQLARLRMTVPPASLAPDATVQATMVADAPCARAITALGHLISHVVASAFRIFKPHSLHVDSRCSQTYREGMRPSSPDLGESETLPLEWMPPRTAAHNDRWQSRPRKAPEPPRRSHPLVRRPLMQYPSLREQHVPFGRRGVGETPRSGSYDARPEPLVRPGCSRDPEPPLPPPQRTFIGARRLTSYKVQSHQVSRRRRRGVTCFTAGT